MIVSSVQTSPMPPVESAVLNAIANTSSDGIRKNSNSHKIEGVLSSISAKFRLFFTESRVVEVPFISR